MIDSYKTKTQLIDELGKLRRQIAELDKTKIKLKKIDEALWESEEIFYKIFSSALDGIIITNSEGRVAFWNRAAEKMLGYSAEEVIGKLIYKLIIPQKNWTKLESELPKFKKTGKGSTIDKVTEGVLLRKDGEKLTVEISLSSIQLWKQWYAIAIVHDITEHKRAEEKIKASLKEREAMMREIHHRVKNNMQIISSLLRLQSRQVKNKKIQDFFNVYQNRIRSMALIHESLYRSEDLAMINFSDYINKLTTHLLAMYRTGSGNIDLRTEVDDVFLDINRAIPCGLIINEFVSNSLKHAFPEGVKGEITVKMYSDKKGKYILIVSDTGIGLPEKIDFGQVKTLGLQMVKDLVNQLNGTISLYRKRGTTFKITF